MLKVSSTETWQLDETLISNKKQNTDISPNSINIIENFNNFFVKVGRLTNRQPPPHINTI